MNESSLARLVQAADRDAGPPRVLARDLVARVHREAERRRTLRVLRLRLAAATGLAAGLALLFVGLGSAGQTVIIETNDRGGGVALANNSMLKGPSDDPVLRQLDADIAERETAVRLFTYQSDWLEVESRLAAMRRVRELEAGVRGGPDYEADAVAALMLDSADRTLREFRQPDVAADSYQLLIRSWPGSRWAQIAQERLNDIREHKGAA